ncbi:cohesin domain-containing protein [Piscinibacter koreensis]|uniref:PEP-CTERM sorting domain-containing protein n=1 Tax=Piscinibacter koreensis TaxID=2742824 RepID=A0A7Y6NK28_9BURK|nr:cohesin domain-containing protein [Schlegelella koreensis]NUZ04645.1 PEP-CTERM sorting domain-containing protein [Schlegelella koreensis]
MLNSLRIATRAAGACALALALWSPAQAAPVVEMSTVNSTGRVDLTVRARDLVDLYAYQFTLNFDPTLVNAQSGSEGSFLPSGGTTFFNPGDIDNAAGSISFVFGSLLGLIDGVNGSGDLATFSFNVARSGRASFSLSDVLLLDSTGGIISADVRDLVAAVPEPASLGLVALGLFAAFGRRSMKSRAA